MTGDPVDLLEQLKQLYLEEDDPLAGRCLPIPKQNFQRHWIDELRAQGCEITEGNRGLHPMVFVSLPKTSVKTSESMTSTESTEPAAAPSGPWLGKAWTKDEDKEIIKGVTLSETDAQIAKRLPGRTEVATKQRRKRLEKHGILPSKKTGKTGRPRKPLIAAPGGEPFPITTEKGASSESQDLPARASTSIPRPMPGPAPTSKTQPFTIHTTLCINLNVNCNDAFSVQNALKVLEEARRTQ